MARDDASLFARAKAAARHRAGTWLACGRNLVGRLNPYLSAPLPYPPRDRPRVLVVGVYLARHPNEVPHLVKAFQSARACQIEQRWVGLGGLHDDAAVRGVTVHVQETEQPKFTMINRVLSAVDLGQYHYVVVSDDDIRVRSGFIDSFIGCQQHYDFAVAQPARTLNSFHDHAVVRRQLRSRARQTWFVEIGPFFAVRWDVLNLLLPFDDTSPMGYGYDLVWPALIRNAGKRMGIVDCCPVDHSLRKTGAYYAAETQRATQQEFLAAREHVPYVDAMKTIQPLR
jgi:hypothetical protein